MTTRLFFTFSSVIILKKVTYLWENHDPIEICNLTKIIVKYEPSQEELRFLQDTVCYLKIIKI